MGFLWRWVLKYRLYWCYLMVQCDVLGEEGVWRGVLGMGVGTGYGIVGGRIVVRLDVGLFFFCGFIMICLEFF